MRLPLLILAGQDPPDSGFNSFEKGGEISFRSLKLTWILKQFYGNSIIEKSIDVYSIKFKEIFIAGSCKDFGNLNIKINVIDVFDYGDIPVGTRLRKSLQRIHALGYDLIVITTCDILPNLIDIEKVLKRYDSLSEFDDVSIMLPYCISINKRKFGKYTYPFKIQGGCLTYGLPGQFWIVNINKIRLPFVEWSINACYLRRFPAGMSRKELGRTTKQRHEFLKETRVTLLKYIWKAWKKQVENESLLFTFRYLLTIFHFIWYMTGGIRSIKNQERFLQKAFIKPCKYKRNKRQVAIEILDIPSLAEDIDRLDDYANVFMRMT